MKAHTVQMCSEKYMYNYTVYKNGANVLDSYFVDLKEKYIVL